MVRYWSVQLLLAVAVLLIGGCAQRAVSVSTLADREYPFTAMGTETVQVVMANTETSDPIQREALDLELRNILGGVEHALAQNGFTIVGNDTAALTMRVVTRITSGERETYRTVPVHEHTHGTIETRRGPRRFHGTTTTSVVVPHREQYTDRLISLFASLPAGPNGESGRSIWVGRVYGPRSAIDEDVSAAIGQLLNYWGQTVTRSVRY